MGAAAASITNAQGTSTLTQQLARNVYLSQKRSYVRKIREALTAIQLETYYTKDELLELYLNMVYLGAGVYGVEAASQRYFGKPVKELGLAECATLAGCIQLPEHYRPDKKRNHKRTMKRRNTVLHSMGLMGYVPKEKVKEVSKEPIIADPVKKLDNRAPYFVEMVRQYMEDKYGADRLYNDGLTIYTTLDPVANDSAKAKIDNYLDSLQRRTNALFLDSTKAFRDINVKRSFFLDNFDSLYTERKDEYKELPDSMKLRIVQTSVVALDVHTGAIKVLIGGRDFLENRFNRAIQAKRQPGSSFKPFVYTVGIDSGYTPASIIMDQPITLETPEGLWRPENYEHEFHGPTTLRDALRRSVNLVAIQVLMDVGVHNVINFARKAGLKHRLSPVPALAIGACEATPMEMASAYSIYTNYGNQATPYFIEAIVDRNGRLLEQHEHEEKEIISPQTAFLMGDMMTSVVRAGTGTQIIKRGFTRQAAGKTGTTNDYSDAWFVGYTAQMACAVWTGVDERRSMGYGVTGAKGSIPVWVSTMKALHRDLPEMSFPRPEGIEEVPICTETHGLATKYCPKPYTEYVKSDCKPEECTEHVLHKSNSNTQSRFGTTTKPKKKKTSTLIF